MPPERNINIAFLKDFLSGRKRLIKIGSVNFVSKIYGFKELTVANVFETFPDRTIAKLYLSEVTAFCKFDKQYVLNVHW